MFMDLKGPSSLIKERKEDKHTFWELSYGFESIVDIAKKVPSLVSLIACIEFHS